MPCLNTGNTPTANVKNARQTMKPGGTRPRITKRIVTAVYISRLDYDIPFQAPTRITNASMCIYARTVFACPHEVWGQRIKSCRTARDYEAGRILSMCAARLPHGLHSRKLSRKCAKCVALDRKLAEARSKMQECRGLIVDLESRVQECRVLFVERIGEGSSESGRKDSADDAKGTPESSVVESLDEKVNTGLDTILEEDYHND